MAQTTTSTKNSLHEHSFNLQLARVLRKLSPVWNDLQRRKIEVERQTAGKRVDLLFSLSDPDIFLAAEVAYDRNGADLDAQNRLGLRIDARGEIKTAIAIVPPKGTKNLSSEDEVPDFLENHPMEYAVYFQDGERYPRNGWVEGYPYDLAEFILRCKIPPESLHAVAKASKNAIDEAAKLLQDGLNQSCKNAISGIMHENEANRAVHSACLCIFDALHAQDRICNMLTQSNLTDHNQNPETRQECRIRGCTDANLLPQKVIRSWRNIRNINYDQIYRISQKCLEHIERDPNMSAKILNILDRAVERAIAENIEPGTELAQAIFPLIVQDRRESAAFYTRPETAELLHNVAFPQKQGLHPKGELPKAADFACGTGRLLGSFYTMTQEFMERNQRDPRSIHQVMVEKNLVGTDIHSTAIHLSALSLSMKQPTVPCYGTQLGITPITDHRTRTGSLQLLVKEEIEDLFGTNSIGGKANVIQAKDEDFDYVCMNPPYSRTRGGQRAFDVQGQSDDERHDSQRELARISRRSGSTGNMQAGLGSHFAFLARSKLKTGGKLAIVLPLTAAAAETWRGIRKTIETEFSHIIAITHIGGSTGSNSMSEDTGMGEMILIATKRKPKPQEKIICVNLLHRIEGSLDGMCIGQAISRHLSSRRTRASGKISLGNEIIAEYVQENRSTEGDPWKGLGLGDTSLVTSMEHLEDSYLWTGSFQNRIALTGVQMRPLREIMGTGPTHDLIGHIAGRDDRGAFEFVPIIPSNLIPRNPSIWASDSTRQKRLVCDPTHDGTPMDRNKARKMRALVSQIHIQKGLRYTSQALVSAYTNDSIMGGNGWNSIQGVPIGTEKTLCLWLNSTIGILAYLKEAQRQQKGRGMIRIKQMGNLLVPDLSNLSSKQIAFANKAFRKIARSELLPIAQMADDLIREEIDLAIIRILGLPKQAEKTLEDLRRRLGSEPSITA